MISSSSSCTIVLHVAGDVPASPVVGSSTSPAVPFYPRLGVVPSSALIPASPSIADALCELAREPPVLSFCAFPSMDSLPSEVFLSPPGGPRPRRTLEQRQWYHGRRLRPAYVPYAGATADEFLLVPAEWPRSAIPPVRVNDAALLPATSWGYRPVLVSPARRAWAWAWVELVEMPARYDDPRMVPFLECAAAWAGVFVVVPAQWRLFMVSVAHAFLVVCVVIFV
ncbi:hypothetical protein OH76DRAFT_1175329 [Lentinus brumalis]|uniref:Uncharacterized protein n=1 Tax=Lentinus brumalis TaxID=2498619 RepID=A0A371CU03_9APHY|nr:hypothetical protein OH76DRAFT_1175329 [Polyporus brumalis]